MLALCAHTLQALVDGCAHLALRSLPNSAPAGEAEAEEMAAAEAHVLSTLDWVGQGLISAANDSGRDDPHDQEDGDSSGSGGGMDQQGRGSTGAEGRGA